MPKLTLIGIIISVLSLIIILAPKKVTKTEITTLSIGGLILGILLIVGSGMRIVNAGNIGVQTFFGNVKDKVLDAGIHVVNPLIKVTQMSIRTQAYTMSGVIEEGQYKSDDAIVALTSDGVSIKLDVTVWFHLIKENAADVYKNIGMDYTEKIVRPAARTAVRNAVVEFKAEDIYSAKRNDVVQNMESQLESDLGKRGIKMEKILLRNVILPPLISRAIDEKISALQDAQKMEFVLQKEELEAKRKELEAKGIAKSQTIIADSLTESYLTWYYIQALKGLAGSENNAFVIAPFDQKLVPLLNVNAKENKK